MTYIDKDALLGWLRDFKASEHGAKHCDLMDTGSLDGEEALEAVIEHVEQTEKGERSLSCRCYVCGCKNDRVRNFCPNCGAEMKEAKR